MIHGMCILCIFFTLVQKNKNKMLLLFCYVTLDLAVLLRNMGKKYHKNNMKKNPGNIVYCDSA